MRGDYSDDYITIYDVNDDDGISTVIASLTGPDLGPISSEEFYEVSLWHNKIISSTHNKMLVEFKSGYINEGDGFSATILYSPLPSKECENGLDMTKKTIQSPNHPDLHNNNLTCKWLISVPDGSHITLNFSQFNVRFFNSPKPWRVLIPSFSFLLSSSPFCLLLLLTSFYSKSSFLSLS